jgi:hypothetical protein
VADLLVHARHRPLRAVLLSVLLVPGDYPRALDVAAGVFLIVAAS